MTITEKKGGLFLICFSLLVFIVSSLASLSVMAIVLPEISYT